MNQEASLEIRQQMEEDYDLEFQMMQRDYEKRLCSEKETYLILKGESGIMKKQVRMWKPAGKAAMSFVLTRGFHSRADPIDLSNLRDVNNKQGHAPGVDHCLLNADRVPSPYPYPYSLCADCIMRTHRVHCCGRMRLGAQAS